VLFLVGLDASEVLSCSSVFNLELFRRLPAKFEVILGGIWSIWIDGASNFG